MECWCFLRNVERKNGDTSPYCKRNDVEFKGKAIPFGCGVWYIPSPTRKDSIQSKADPRQKLGIFMGYRLAPGGKWNGEYLVIDIEKFVNTNLHYTAAPTTFKGIVPHVTKSVDYYHAGADLGEVSGIKAKFNGVDFPLKEKYEQYNTTLEGAGYAQGRDKKDEDVWLQLIEKGFLERYQTDDEGYQLPKQEESAPAQPEEAEEPVEELWCINCNKVWPSGKFCSECGQVLIKSDPPKEEDTGLPEGVRKVVDAEGNTIYKKTFLDKNMHAKTYTVDSDGVQIRRSNKERWGVPKDSPLTTQQFRKLDKPEKKEVKKQYIAAGLQLPENYKII